MWQKERQKKSTAKGLGRKRGAVEENERLILVQALERNTDICQEGSVSVDDIDVAFSFLSLERSVLKCCTSQVRTGEECVLQKRWRSLYIYTHRHIHVCVQIYFFFTYGIYVFPPYIQGRGREHCVARTFALQRCQSKGRMLRLRHNTCLQLEGK